MTRIDIPTDWTGEQAVAVVDWIQGLVDAVWSARVAVVIDAVADFGDVTGGVMGSSGATASVPLNVMLLMPLDPLALIPIARDSPASRVLPQSGGVIA